VITPHQFHLCSTDDIEEFARSPLFLHELFHIFQAHHAHTDYMSDKTYMSDAAIEKTIRDPVKAFSGRYG